MYVGEECEMVLKYSVPLQQNAGKNAARSPIASKTPYSVGGKLLGIAGPNHMSAGSVFPRVCEKCLHL